MDINELLIKKGMTVYKLSQETGIAKSTLYDICSGKANILDCSVRTLLKLADAFEVDINYLINLKPIMYNQVYETEIPEFLKTSLDRLKRNMRNGSPYYDCFWDDTYASINVCEVEQLISSEHANYLRYKYLWRSE